MIVIFFLDVFISFFLFIWIRRMCDCMCEYMHIANE